MLTSFQVSKCSVTRLRTFVLSKGLVELQALEIKGTKALADSVTSFSCLDLHPISYPRSDSIYLVSQGIYTWFGTRHIVNRYPDDDPGPCDTWMHTLLQCHTYQAIFEPGRYGIFKCGATAIDWGFVFWDRHRIDTIARHPIPTSEEMIAACSQQRAYTRDVDERTTHRGSISLPCHCRIVCHIRNTREYDVLSGVRRKTL